MRGINSYRFLLQNEGVQRAELDKREKLVQQLEKLNVKIDKPNEMKLEHLELLVKHHRKTVESKNRKVEQRLMTRSDIARRWGVPLYIVRSRAVRQMDFPPVDTRVSNGRTPLYALTEVVKYERRRGIKLAEERKSVKRETPKQRRARRQAEMARMIAKLNAEEQAE